MTYLSQGSRWHGDPLPAEKIVESIIADMKRAAFRDKSPEAFDAASDQLTVFTMAHILPTANENWRKYKFSRQQAIIADLLYSKMGKTVTFEAMMNAMYFDRAGDEPSPMILKVRVCQMRSKLKGSPYTIETVWGRGYAMTTKPNNSIAA